VIDHQGGHSVVVRSAGSRPADTSNLADAQILSERGLDVSKEFPKPLNDEIARSADIISTMGYGDACPVYPGKRYLDWELADPIGKAFEDVRRIVDDIERRALAFLRDLGIRPTSTP
jgi:protein-tyrosine-phosphatase